MTLVYRHWLPADLEVPRLQLDWTPAQDAFEAELRIDKVEAFGAWLTTHGFWPHTVGTCMRYRERRTTRGEVRVDQIDEMQKDMRRRKLGFVKGRETARGSWGEGRERVGMWGCT